MVDGHGRLKADRAVAVFADVGRQYMQWTLAGGGSAVVTTTAVTRDAGVIESGR